ncbi:MAG: DNA primase [Lachnospiraceae bacterium]|nr:DNA primase [Lachnospiraceae bacterium]
MYYSEEVIEEVRSRSDIVDVIGNYVQLKKKGNSYFGLCPFHNEKTGSFSVSRDKQMFYCFGCGKGGSVFTFLMEYENYTYPEAIEYLAGQAGVELPKQELTEEQKQMADYRATLREMNKDAANYFYCLLRREHGRKGYEYFQNRGIMDETIAKFGLGYSDIYRDDLYCYLKQKGYTDSQLRDSGLVEIDEHGGHDKFWNRVMFPIVDMNGKVIGFGGRVMGDGEPKYLNSRETALFEKKKNLYGLHLARRSKRQGFILCEGYMDVISMHQAGFDNAVASLGTAYTEEQARLLKRYRNYVYLAYDNDGAGQKAALRAIEICRNVDLPARVISMAPYKDPDEFIKNLGAEEYEKRLQQSISGIMFELQVLAQQYRLEDPEERTQFQREMAKRLATIGDVYERENYIEAAAAQYQMNPRSILNMVNRVGEQQQKTAGYERLQEEDRQNHRREVEKAKDGKLLQEKLLLTWIANQPAVWKKLDGIVIPEDFSNELTREIMNQFTRQVQNTGTINPAEMIDAFPDVEQHSKVSAILNEEVRFEGSEEEDPGLKREFANKAITETVRRIKEESLNRQMKEVTESQMESGEKSRRFLELMEQQQKLKNLYITLDNG